MRLQIISFLTVAVATTQSAFAADMPIKAPIYKAPPRVVEQPTGFYFGGHIGGGWTYNNFSDPTGAFFPSASRPTGNEFLGGVQAGYNWQFGQTVLGVQGDISFTDINATTLAAGSATTVVGNDTKWISTLTGRVGYAWDKTLWYAKGGAAWVRNHYAMLDGTTPFSYASNNTRSGYVVGGGMEYAIAPNWSSFIEYNYIELANKSIVLTDGLSGATTPLNIYQNIQTVKVGVNYKFSAPRW